MPIHSKLTSVFLTHGIRLVGEKPFVAQEGAIRICANTKYEIGYEALEKMKEAIVSILREDADRFSAAHKIKNPAEWQVGALTTPIRLNSELPPIHKRIMNRLVMDALRKMERTKRTAPVDGVPCRLATLFFCHADLTEEKAKAVADALNQFYERRQIYGDL